MHKPTSLHMQAVKRILRYLKSTISYGLLLLHRFLSRILQAYSNADWVGYLDDRKSFSNFYIFLVPNLIYWSSHKQRIMLALAQNLNSAPRPPLLLNSSQSNPYFVTSAFFFPPILWCDNMGTTYLMANPAFHAGTKHIEIDFILFQDKVASKTLDVHFLCRKENLADIFTKPIMSPRFSYMWNKLNVMCQMSRLWE